MPRKDLKPGLDFVYDKHHALYAWKELEPQCVFYTTGNYNFSLTKLADFFIGKIAGRGTGGSPAGDDEYEQDGRKYGLYKPNHQVVQSRPHKRPSSEVVIQEFIPFNQNRPPNDDSFPPVENEYPGYDHSSGDKYLPPSNPNPAGWSAGEDSWLNLEK